MKITKASDNLFVDLGFDAAEAANLKLRSQLMIDLEQFIEVNKLTQSDAAHVFGIQQSRVSDLVRGKIDRFSLDMLVNLMVKAGFEVTLSVKKAA